MKLKKLLPILLSTTLLLSSACTPLSSVPDDETTQQTQDTETVSDSSQSIQPTICTPADIASYNGIIALFKSAVECFPSHHYDNRDSATYPSDLSFANDEERQLYDALFWSGYKYYRTVYAREYLDDGRQCYGYAITDLNQNGSPELLLLTDTYYIAAIFSTENGKPRLIFDNADGSHSYRINKKGQICDVRHTSSLNPHLKTFNLSENDQPIPELHYVYETKPFDFYYNLQGDIQATITKEEWLALKAEIQPQKGLSVFDTAGYVTQSSVDLPFVHLFGSLNIRQPSIVSWCWSEYEGINDFYLAPQVINQNQVRIEFLNHSHAEIYSFEATRKGDKVYFETDTLTGRMEFGLDSIWLIIEKSTLEQIPCETYFMRHYQTSFG